MKVNAFNDLAEIANKEHLAYWFGVPINRGRYGIDLVDHKNRIGIELKAVILQEGKQYFKTGVHQIYNYQKQLEGYDLFWAFMTFKLNKPINDIQPFDIKDSIGKRESWIFSWDYIHTFTAFDDEIFEAKGSHGKKALFRILGLSNPKPARARKPKIRKNTTPNLFKEVAEYESLKKNMKIPQGSLYIRPDRTTIIKTADSTLKFETRRCERLIEAYIKGPYQQQMQLELNL